LQYTRAKSRGAAGGERFVGMPAASVGNPPAPSQQPMPQIGELPHALFVWGSDLGVIEATSHGWRLRGLQLEESRDTGIALRTVRTQILCRVRGSFSSNTSVPSSASTTTAASHSAGQPSLRRPALPHAVTSIACPFPLDALVL
jgi:hypothetical protein